MHYEGNHISIWDLVWDEYMTSIYIYWFDEIVSFEIKIIIFAWANLLIFKCEYEFAFGLFCENK